VSDELDKLSGLEPVSPEFNVTRTYLEWLTSLPWGVYSKEIFDIQHAQQVGGGTGQGVPGMTKGLQGSRCCT
jgi:ATP-dependent Lon protease